MRGNAQDSGRFWESIQRAEESADRASLSNEGSNISLIDAVKGMFDPPCAEDV